MLATLEEHEGCRIESWEGCPCIHLALVCAGMVASHFKIHVPYFLQNSCLTW